MASASSAALAAVGQREALIDAWERRQESVRTFHFSWLGTHFTGAEAVVVAAGRQAQGSTVGAADASIETEMSLDVDGSARFRFDDHGKVWSLDNAAYVPQTTTDLLDGDLWRSFASHSTSCPFPNASVNPQKGAPAAKGIRSLPVMTVYRPFDPLMGYFDRAKLRLTTEQGIVDGRSCIVVRQTDERGYERVVWADPGRGFIPLRYFSGPRGQITIQFDVSYSKDARYEWVPCSWNISLMDRQGKITEGWTSNSIKYILNQAIHDDTFKLSYPPGTWVHDYVAKEEYVALRTAGNDRLCRGSSTARTSMPSCIASPAHCSARAIER